MPSGIESYIEKNNLGAPYVGNGFYGSGLDYMSSDNPMYDAYFKANPYVGQTYKKTIWDNLFDGIFRTGYDKWRDEMAVNSAQYNAGIVDLEQQNQYNSEVEKAQRMRQAGLNPDLLGTGDVSDSARPMADPQDVQIPEALDMSQVASFAGMVSQCFQGAVGMAKAGIDLMGSLSAVNSQNIANASSMQDLALGVIRQNIPSEGFSTDSDYLSWLESLHDMTNPDLKWSQSLAHSLGLNRTQRKAFEQVMNSTIGSLPAELDRAKMSEEFADKRLSFARKTSSKFYDESMEVMKGLNVILVADNDELMEIIAKNKVRSAQVESQSLENESLTENIESAYLTELDKRNAGLAQGQIEMEGYNLQKIQQSIDKKLKQTKQKMLDYLEKLAGDGNDFATYMIHNMMLKEYMNFEFKAKGELGLFKQLPKSVQGWLPNFGADVEFGASM